MKLIKKEEEKLFCSYELGTIEETQENNKESGVNNENEILEVQNGSNKDTKN